MKLAEIPCLNFFPANQFNSYLCQTCAKLVSILQLSYSSLYAVYEYLKCSSDILYTTARSENILFQD